MVCVLLACSVWRSVSHTISCLLFQGPSAMQVRKSCLTGVCSAITGYRTLVEETAAWGAGEYKQVVPGFNCPVNNVTPIWTQPWTCQEHQTCPTCDSRPHGGIPPVLSLSLPLMGAFQSFTVDGWVTLWPCWPCLCEFYDFPILLLTAWRCRDRPPGKA